MKHLKCSSSSVVLCRKTVQWRQVQPSTRSCTTTTDALNSFGWKTLSPASHQNKGWSRAWLWGGKAARIAVPGHLLEQWRVSYQVEECCCLSLTPIHALEKLANPPVLPKIAGTCRHLLQKKCLCCSWALLLENSHHSFLTQNTFPLKFTHCMPTCECLLI